MNSEYMEYRGKCKEMSEALVVIDPTLRLVRGHYQHSGCMQVEVEIDSDNDYSDSATWRNSEDTVIQCMRDFADWIYKRLEEEYEYQISDEIVAEACEANGYEFYEDGSIV